MAKERPPIEEMTLRQLRRVASEYNISRYSRMRKAQLLAEIKLAEIKKISEVPFPDGETKELPNIEEKSHTYVPRAPRDAYVDIYIKDDNISDQDIQELELQVTRLMEVCGFYVVTKFPPEKGSWFRHFRFQSKKALTNSEEHKIYENVKKALRLKAFNESVEIKEPNYYSVANQFLETVKPFDNVVIHIGDLLLVKFTKGNKSSLFIETISKEISRKLEENPALLKNPETLIEFLESKSNISFADCSHSRDERIYRQHIEDIKEIFKLQNNQTIQTNINIKNKTESDFMPNNFKINQNEATNPNVAVAADNAIQKVNITQTTLEQDQNLVENVADLQQLLNQIRNNQDVSIEDAQHQIAKDLVAKAKSDSTFKKKLIHWGQYIGDTAAKTSVSEAVKGVIKLALTLL